MAQKLLLQRKSGIC